MITKSSDTWRAYYMIMNSLKINSITDLDEYVSFRNQVSVLFMILEPKTIKLSW